MNWTTCYDDGCRDYKGNKDDNGWYPKKPITKIIAATIAYNSDNNLIDYDCLAADYDCPESNDELEEEEEPYTF